MKNEKFTQKETLRAAKFFSKVPRQPIVKHEEDYDNYYLQQNNIVVKTFNKTIKIYNKNKKILQFTNNKISNLYSSICPSKKFVAFSGEYMYSDISQLYLFDVVKKKIVYQTSRAFMTFEWHKNKLLISGRPAENFTKAYGNGCILELNLDSLEDKEVYQSPSNVILYLNKYKSQLYINELKTQFNSFYLLSDNYEKQPLLDLHKPSKQSLFTTKNNMWRVKHTFRNPFGSLQKINVPNKKIVKSLSFKGWVTLESCSHESSNIFALVQMNTKGIIRIISLNQNGTIKDTWELPLSTTISENYYSQGSLHIKYKYLDESGLLSVNGHTGKIKYKNENFIDKLEGLTVQLKKFENSWIYLYQLGEEPIINKPTLIYTYGGFGVEPGVNLKDYYSFLKKGGIVAEICPRGGIHEVFRYRWNTSRGQKEKTINDVINATKFLINKGISQSGKIGLTGASNGGFVVGAVMNKAPHLYRAVLSEVGVMDLVNYDQYTGGDVWSCEYGTKKSKLKKLSPIENIKNKQYPAIYVVSGKYDTRVAPIHQIKYTKALKAHGHQVLFQSFPEGHSISSRTLSQNTAKFFTHYLIND